MKRLPLLLLLGLTGCVSASKQIKLQNQAYIDECGYNDPVLDPIRDKVDFFYTGDSNKRTTKLKANKTYATEAEKQVIAIWIQKRDACNSDEHNMLRLRNKQVVDDLIMLLYTDKITYGTFTSMREHVFRLAIDVEALEEDIRRHSD